MDDLLTQFLIEARELVQQATEDLLDLERNPADRARIDSAFRAVHTLKGSVGLFDLVPMGRALHAGEDVLGAIREGRSTASRAAVDALLELLGQTERWIEALERSGELPAEAVTVGERLAVALRLRLPPGPAHREEIAALDDAAWADELAHALGTAGERDLGDAPLLAIRYVPDPDCFFAGDDPLGLVRSLPDVVALRLLPREPWGPAHELAPFACNLVIEAVTRRSRDEVQPIFRFVPDQVRFHDLSARQRASPSAPADVGQADGSGGPSPLAGSSTLRVDSTRIDQLVDLVGELVVAKNTLSFIAGRASAGAEIGQLVGEIRASQATISRLVLDLHAAVMDIRVLPLRGALRGLPRAVRDLSGRLGKEVELTIEGAGVEADKSVVDALSEPLLHLVRNAVDHGAESPQDRLAAGKSARARIDVRARRERDRIVVEIADDGRGLDPARIRRIAREKRLGRDEVIAAMSDAEAVDLIFTPGFSTAGQVTEVSGRGVGMDAVRVAVERLGGRVSVASVPGQGTTVRLVVPATAVITQVMVVRVGAETFGLPMDAVMETTRVPRDRVIPIGSGEAFVFRDRTLPLLHLAALLGGTSHMRPDEDLRVLLVAAGPGLVGIAVDSFGERMDIMVRPITGILAGLSGFAGTALRGDGRVLMILDIPELIA